MVPTVSGSVGSSKLSTLAMWGPASVKGLLTIAGERKQMERNVGSAPQTRSFTLGAKVEF